MNKTGVTMKCKWSAERFGEIPEKRHAWHGAVAKLGFFEANHLSCMASSTTSISWGAHWNDLTSWLERRELFNVGVSVANQIKEGEMMRVSFGRRTDLFCYGKEAFFACFADVQLHLAENEQKIEVKFDLLREAKANLIEADKTHNRKDVTWVSHNVIGKQVNALLQQTETSLIIKSQVENQVIAEHRQSAITLLTQATNAQDTNNRITLLTQARAAYVAAQGADVSRRYADLGQAISNIDTQLQEARRQSTVRQQQEENARREAAARQLEDQTIANHRQLATTFLTSVTSAPDSNTKISLLAQARAAYVAAQSIDVNHRYADELRQAINNVDVQLQETNEEKRQDQIIAEHRQSATGLLTQATSTADVDTRITYLSQAREAYANAQRADTKNRYTNELRQAIINVDDQLQEANERKHRDQAIAGHRQSATTLLAQAANVSDISTRITHLIGAKEAYIRAQRTDTKNCYTDELHRSISDIDTQLQEANERKRQDQTIANHRQSAASSLAQASDALDVDTKITHLTWAKEAYLAAQGADNNNRYADELRQAVNRIDAQLQEAQDRKRENQIIVSHRQLATTLLTSVANAPDSNARISLLTQARAAYVAAQQADSSVRYTDLSQAISIIDTQLQELRIQQAIPAGVVTVRGNRAAWTEADTELLGVGSTARVYKGVFFQNAQGNTQTQVAIKKFTLASMRDDDKIKFDAEVNLMMNISSEYVVNIFDSVANAPHYCLVMEYMPGGSLYTLLGSRMELPWDRRWTIVMDVSQAVKALHDGNIIHRDIKSLNVLISDTGRAKLADFGQAKIVSSLSSTMTARAREGNVGTVVWKAPELLSVPPAKCSKETDIYSYGMVLWEIATRKTPFSNDPYDELDIDQKKDCIKQGVKEDLSQIEHEHKQPKLARLVSWCWQQPNNRPTAEQAVKAVRDAMSEHQTEGQRVPLLFSS